MKDKEKLMEIFDKLDNSSLLKHEVTYALGQMEWDKKTGDFLISVLENKEEEAVVRHEAGEALANYGREEYMIILEKQLKDKMEEVRDTCELGLEKLKRFEKEREEYGLKYSNTIEPACGASLQTVQSLFDSEFNLSFCLCSQDQQVQYLTDLIFNQSNLFIKYSLLYFIRNYNAPHLYQVYNNLLSSINRHLTNILIRHEVCFIIGQLASNAKCTLQQLILTIQDQSESEIVRHEAISGYVSLSDDKSLLIQYSNDQSRLLRESCLVALDLIDYWNIC